MRHTKTLALLVVISLLAGGYYFVHTTNDLQNNGVDSSDDQQVTIHDTKQAKPVNSTHRQALETRAENTLQVSVEQKTEEANPNAILQDEIAAGYANLAEHKRTENSTLDDKIAYEKQTAELVNKQSGRAQKSMEEDQEMASMVQKVMEPLFKEEWDEFLNEIELVDQEGMQSPEMLAVYLMMAIQKNAPFSVIERLIQRGAQLTGEVVHVLALFNKITLAQKLLPLGLDVNALSVLGDNGLSSTVKNQLNKEMFYFLLQHQINPNPPYNGLDALDYLLQWTTAGNVDAIEIIGALVNHGASIKRSHRQVVEILAQDSPNMYQQLIEQVPSLTP